MSAVLSALIPVFLVIALGVFLKRTLLPSAEAWDSLERLIYFVLFPALLITTTATADFRNVPAAGVGGALFTAILGVGLVLIALHPLIVRALAINGPAYTSVFQGAMRWNTFVALSIAASLHGALGLALASVAMVAMIPLLNVLCVIVLAWYAADKAPDAKSVLDQLVRNPLIWSVIVGLTLNLSGLPLPKVIISFGDILGRGALAVGLLVVGAGLELDKTLRPSAAVLTSVLIKLLLMPTVAIGIGLAMGLSGAALSVVAIASSMPTAPGAYVLARQMRGDAALIARIISLETVAAVATIPVAIAAAQWLAP